MSIPLDRLYHYIEHVAQEIYSDDVLIYRFYPHGSKKIEDLIELNKNSVDYFMLPHLYCHDQEPLNFDYYENQVANIIDQQLENIRVQSLGHKNRIRTNLRKNAIDINNMAMLLHSEKNSPEVEKYLNHSMIPVYYWSHAIIAQDWYRFAQHVQQIKQVKKTFLIYNRAWSGTREYRLKFAELLLRFGLSDICQMNLNVNEPELNVHYKNHKFNNYAWKPSLILDGIFPACDVGAHASADFEITDYENTEIEVVLETLFDDQRIQLTEKSLRPIACGQPFILASGPGSLKYLKEYGFQTFSTLWNEDYDTIVDSQQRLLKIVNLMKSIQSWSVEEKVAKLNEAQKITNYNKKLFFSKTFSQQITDELKNNLGLALDIFNQHNNYSLWYNRWNLLLKDPEFVSCLKQKNYTVWNTKNLLSTIDYINKIK
jgi:hypothetical protein